MVCPRLGPAALFSTSTLKRHFLGEGDYDLHKGLPRGTADYQCEVAPSGHLVLPCCEYSRQEPTIAISQKPLVLIATAASPAQADPDLVATGSKDGDVSAARQTTESSGRSNTPQASSRKRAASA